MNTFLGLILNKSKRERQEECLMYLVESAKADPSACDRRGLTPLHYAAAKNNPTAAAFLIDNSIKIEVEVNDV